MKKFQLNLSIVFFCLSAFVWSQKYNYGEALQKSILFYEAQQSGKLPSWNRVSWRGDAAVKDGSDVGLDLSGGWHDAGDHIKFGLPMAFAATALNWGFLEYTEGYEKAGQVEHFKRNIKWVTDYFIKCHPTPNEFYAQISEKSQDHSFWMPAEMVEVHPQYGQRKSFKLSTTNPGTDVACETAAALASASMVFKDSDPAYSALLLRHAKELYTFGDTYRGIYTEEGNIPAKGTYPSNGIEDELVWGAIWLYKATGDTSYLTKAEAAYAQPDFLWSLVWDDKSYGSMVMLAEITGKQKYKDDAEKHLQFWQKGTSGVTYSPGGHAHLTQWGSFRHAMNAALTAFIYSDKVDTPNKKQYHDFAVDQINYILGDNPNDRSFQLGFGKNPPNKPHHRGQHSSWFRSESIPEESRHTLYGALMGGTSRPDDVFVEDRSDFQANEVAVDYNACFQGVLARMVMEFGGKALNNFPQPEVPGEEFLNEVRINGSSSRYTEVAIWLNNRSGWPARVPGRLSARYFVDISEGIAAGLTPDDYEITARGNGKAVGGLQVWEPSKNIYYVEVEVDQDKIPFPGGQGEHRSEIQLRVAVSNNTSESAWDPTNDYSAQGLTNNLEISNNIPIYVDGKLAGGTEPFSTLNTEEFSKGVELVVYPTPARDYLTISGSILNGTSSKASIVSMTGAVLYNTSFESNQDSYKLNVSQLSPGVYFLQIATENGQKGSVKFIK
ncbi:glycoside hydrolase family 9 protein [Aquimarina sp. ERC-38]|uniref:glycoside hydrolase family 9 protein n=1 Tax=Aquimarina sp. ERC-38 TaxID=2949996 RepID=UPI002247C6B1|nr:glycoside hydrolase family 9 protein [Aquimarina sp. ERC-38]UZO79858.1 glycoside hydrolase family 9 protein [Aquimarina sp. ERC-38]